MDTRWKEMIAALAAGTRLVPFGDNGKVYAKLEEELEVVRRESRPGMRAPDDAQRRNRAA